MKMVKSLLLGTAAGLVAMTGAQAADLPVKAKPVQYVKICSLYGAGFYYIPGTDTCIKVGGYMRAEINFNANGSFNAYRSQNFDVPSRNYQVTRTRGMLTVDARSQTEYGTLRSYMNLAANQTNGGQNSSPNIQGQIAPGGNAYSALYSTAAFIQFAGFTIGSTESFFTFDQLPYTNDTALWSTNQSGAGQWLAAYTAQLGNGLSASIAAEDPTSRQSSILTTTATYTVPAIGAAGANGYGGRRWTDFVGNLRIDQAWGSAQIMGAIHDVYAYNSAAANQTFSQTGYAFGAGAKLNLPMLGKGDYIQGQVTWSKGATNYTLQNTGFGAVNSFALTSGFPVTIGSNTALGPVFDAVVTGGATGLDLTTTWSVIGGYEHYWNPSWKTSLYGGYGQTKYSTAASAAIVASGLLGAFAGTGSTSANWSAWQLGSRTTWTPVTNLDLSVDLLYTKVNTAFGGSSSATFGTFSDKGFLAGMFRAQRNFYP